MPSHRCKSLLSLIHIFIDVEHWQVRLPDGSLGLREVALHKGAAAVVPVDEQGRVPMVRQFLSLIHI